MQRSILFALAAIITSALVTPATAQSADVITLSERVAHADLNLNDPHDADRLLDRIERTARRVCGGSANLRTLGERAAFRRCAREAVQVAVLRVDRPVVTNQFAARGGRLDEVLQASLPQ